MTTQLSKSAAQFHDFHTRTGSSSTKGFQNGRVDVLPPHAKEEDLKSLPVAEQFKIAKRNYVVLREKFQADLKSKRLKPQDADFESIREELHKAKNRFEALKQALHLARSECEGALFKEICRRRLRHELYMELVKETESLQEFAKVRDQFQSAHEEGQQ